MLVRTQHVDEGAAGVDCSMILQAGDLKSAKFPARTKTVLLTESLDVELYALTTNDFDDEVSPQMVARAPKDSRFPDASHAIQDLEPKDCHTFAVDPKLLSKLLDVIAKVGTDEECRGVRFTCPVNSCGPIRIDALTDDIATTGVIMPVAMRSDKGYTAPAEWTKKQETA